METRMMELAMRIKRHREMLKISLEEMAWKTGLTPEEYGACERGERDFSFTFLYKCAGIFALDVSELLAGQRFRQQAPERGITVRQRNQNASAKKMHNMTVRTAARGL